MSHRKGAGKSEGGGGDEEHDRRKEKERRSRSNLHYLFFELFILNLFEQSVITMEGRRSKSRDKVGNRQTESKHVSGLSSPAAALALASCPDPCQPPTPTLKDNDEAQFERGEEVNEEPEVGRKRGSGRGRGR